MFSTQDIFSIHFSLLLLYRLFFSAHYNPSAVFAGSVFHVLHFLCCQPTVCCSLPPLITCWLAHLISTLLMLLVACCSHTFHRGLLIGHVTRHSTHSLLFPQQSGVLLSLNVAYGAPVLVLFTSFIIQLTHCHIKKLGKYVCIQ